MSRTVIARHLPAALGCRQLRNAGIMTAASRAAHFVESYVFAAIRSVVRLRPVGAAHPLPAFSRHVEHSVGACSLGKTANIAEVIPARAIVRARRIGLVIAPGISSAVGAARRLF